MELILTPSAEHLELDGRTFQPHPKSGAREFPDGEVYVHIPGAEDIDEALVVHSGMPEPNRGLECLRGTLELLKEKDVGTNLFLTYFPYGMQDSEFFEGDLNKARALLKEFRDFYQVNKIYSMDVHFSNREWFQRKYSTFLENLHMFPRIRRKIKMEDYLVVVPDSGAVDRFGIDRGFEKERRSSFEVEIRGE
ncbi:MAG: hypothetical protein SVV03_05100, partial [Candidatus Nanohaloarchaea archaeon]|nr:hypothetical protein [Candidatus Nanohaloarchaea archaeon]